MATAAQSISGTPSRLVWFGQFLKQELALYEGRAHVIVRMVVAATLVMIICMTFRLSYGFQAAIYALLISRESARATVQSAGTILFWSGVCGAYVVFSAWFVISVPALHFLWVMGSFFLAFYALSTLNSYLASVSFAVIIAITGPLWDRHVSAETNVEDTLRLCFAVLIGALVTLAVELVASGARPGDQVVVGLSERLAAVADLLNSRAQNVPTDQQEANVARLTMVGTSMLRRVLQRSNYSPHAAERVAAVIALTGRLVDIAANIPPASFRFAEAHRLRIRRLAENIESIRSDLLAERTPHWSETSAQAQQEDPHGVPLLYEMERTVRAIPEAFTGSQSLSIYSPPASSGDRSSTLLCRDAFSNIEHFKFGLKGCLTAGLCYVIYNAIAWPGISTAVTTCMLTALTTIGSSRQKQTLRFAGAAVGGFVFGMGAQIFILPSVDSITGFTILFIFVTAVASWFMTSSARLSYFGVQIAVAFDLIHLQEFTIQSSLSIARDRVVGIMLGLVMMWLIFDQLWSAPAGVEMKNTFISCLRLMGQLAREPVSTDLQEAVDRSFSLRDAITTKFDSVRASADAVLFEFGPSREQDLAWRTAIREWQPQLRTLFLTRVALWKYRAQLPGFETPDTIRQLLQEFDDESAKMLEAIADRLEGKSIRQTQDLAGALARLQQAAHAYSLQQPEKAPTPQIETVIQLVSKFEALAISLNDQIRPPETQSSPLPSPQPPKFRVDLAH
jgi:multidrug resistance protein MdtO